MNPSYTREDPLFVSRKGYYVSAKLRGVFIFVRLPAVSRRCELTYGDPYKKSHLHAYLQRNPHRRILS